MKEKLAAIAEKEKEKKQKEKLNTTLLKLNLNLKMSLTVEAPVSKTDRQTDRQTFVDCVVLFRTSLVV